MSIILIFVTSQKGRQLFPESFILIINLTGMEEERSALKIITDKPTGKRPRGRPRRRWEDNIRN